MSSIPPPFNPSHTVERIREIIVGRHFARLEQRVAGLETTASAPAVGAHTERLTLHEANLEALRENVQHLAQATQQHAEQRFAQHRAESQRLAAQIQSVAAQCYNQSSASALPAVQQLEQRIGSWLTDWQRSFHSQLREREQTLLSQIRHEVASLWESTEAHLTRLESRAIDRDSIEERFSRIALAARALAECASPTSRDPQIPVGTLISPAPSSRNS